MTRLAAVLLLAAGAAGAQIVHVWDLADVDQPGQVTIYNPDANDAEFGTPIRSGDLNGDGFDDYVVSAMAADGPPDQVRATAGEVAVWFSRGRFEGAVDLADEHDNVVTIYGESPRDVFGIKSEVADVDGDGQNDLLVGAFYADAPRGSTEGTNAGKLYVISGELLTQRLQDGTDLDLGQPWPDGVRVIEGPEAQARLGVWMATGDVNGDGSTDIVAGADQASGFGATSANQRGQTWMIPGPLTGPATMSLRTPPAGAVVVHGADDVDHLGSTVECADLDGDGYAEIVAGAGAFGTLRNAFDRRGGAGDGPNNDRPEAGELWVVFGAAQLPAAIDLANPPADAMVFYGASGGGDSPDRLGEEIVAADVNGDGRMDLIVGAYRADGPDDSRDDAGDTYIVYGSPTLRGRVLDAEDLPADVVVIYGAVAGAISGDSIAGGDIHGDGYDDIFVGVPGDPGPLDRRLSGGIVVIAGGPTLPRVIDLADPSIPVVWIQAPDEVDFSAYWAAAGDIDGDGHIDVMPNGMAGDGPDNQRRNAGEAHAVSGAMLAQYLAPVVTAVTDASGAQPDRAGLSGLYPNPFNATVTIPFDIATPGRVRLDVFDLAGQRLLQLTDAHYSTGRHMVRWNGLDASGRPAASGVYLVRLTAGDVRHSQKAMLLR